MGNTPSQDAFTDVLPSAEAATHSAAKTGRSGGDARYPVVASATPTDSALSYDYPTAEFETLREEAGQLPNATPSFLRIDPPAHALLQDARQEVPEDTFLIPESVRKSRTLDEFVHVCSEILPNFLYVSNLDVARDTSKLLELGITHVVNCCKELCGESPVPPAPSTITVLKLALHDDVREDLTWFFYQVMEFIDMARAQRSPVPGKVLVHCHQGISRSCAFVIAYTMYQQQEPLGFRAAMAFVKARRPIASPNTAFLCQLLEWERELQSFAACDPAPPLNTLYRLAPHAAHDAETLVLKSCYYTAAPGTAQRRKVVLANEESSWQQWLWSRGIFVFMKSPHQVVIWKGQHCEIVNGVLEARRHVERMIRVRLFQCGAVFGANAEAALAKLGVDIIEVEGETKESDIVGNDADHFGYAEELAWMGRCPSATSTATDDGDDKQEEAPHEHVVLEEEVHSFVISDEKPLLFVLDSISDGDDTEEGSWDQLKQYDSEDLTPGEAFLLCVPSSACQPHYLWIGSTCTATEDVLVRLAERKVQSLPRSAKLSSVPIEIEKEHEESERFWSAFEQGY